MKSRHIGLLLTVSAVGAGSLFLGQDLWTVLPRVGASPAEQEPSSPRSAVPARRLIFASGVVEGAQRSVSLRFEQAGRIETIHVRDGQAVKKGEILVELDSRTLQQRVAEAEARLRLAQAQRERLVNGARDETIEVLKADTQTAEVHVHETESLYSRAQRLAKANSISAQELDDNRYKHDRANALFQAARAKLAEVEAPARTDELQVADAQVALAEATLNYERVLLDQMRMRAPIDGVVLDVHLETGELVGPDDERSLVTMSNRDRIRVRAYVEELDSLAVSIGQTAYVTADGMPGKKYEGVVTSCSPLVRGKSHRHHRPGELVDVKVREIVLEMTAADELVIGLPVDVHIHP